MSSARPSSGNGSVDGSATVEFTNAVGFDASSSVTCAEARLQIESKLPVAGAPAAPVSLPVPLTPELPPLDFVPPALERVPPEPELLPALDVPPLAAPPPASPELPHAAANASAAGTTLASKNHRVRVMRRVRK